MSEMKSFAIVKLKVRVPSNKSLEELKLEIKDHIKKGEFWIKEIDFKMQEGD